MKINLKLTPGIEQQPLTFTSMRSLQSWVEQEREFWSWLEESARHDGLIRNYWNRINSSFTQLSNLIEQYKSNKEQEYRENILNTIQGNLHSLEDNVLLSTDDRAQFSSEIAQEDPVLAGFVVVAFTQPTSLPTNNIRVIQALVYAEVFSRSLSQKGISARRKALQNTQALWQQFVNDAQDAFEEYRSTLDTFVDEMSHSQNTQKEQFEKLIEEAQSKLQAIEKTYDEKLALQAPVKYWAEKAISHKKQSRNISIAFAVASILAAFGLWAEIYFWLVPSFGKTVSVNSNYWPLAIIVGSAVFLLWPLRILSRILLSNIHLRTDAEERITMANTYLSLLRSESGLGDGERRLILETLFRQASTGIVKDDAMPPTIISSIDRLLSSFRGAKL